MERQRIGLIAGNGRFPLVFAQAARAEGLEVIAVAHRGETDPAIEAQASSVTWVRVGELGRLIDTFKRFGVKRAVMAGGITKAKLFRSFRPDLRGAAFLARMRTLKDDHLLRGVAEELRREGIDVVHSTLFLGGIVAREGVLGAVAPSKRQWEDIKLGFRVAKLVGRFDIGQCVVVKGGSVVAVEGLEGTDATIVRAGELAGGELVVVKVSKPAQDLRFDLPAVGPDTIAILRQRGGGVLAVEAEATILLDRNLLLAEADRARIAVVGVTEQSLGLAPTCQLPGEED